MTAPTLSVVVPTLNEARCIERFLEQVSRFLESRGRPWEIVVVDDGSQDETVALAERWSAADSRIRLLRQPHRGKGAAVRRGMLAAQGAWRLMTDADLSVSPDDWAVFLDTAAATDAEVLVGSREAPGARRIDEPMARHVIGRVFNWVVRVFLLPGLQDTQCGFKLLQADAAQRVFPYVTTDGFAFDVELLFLARRAGFRVREVGVVWVYRKDSRVKFSRGAAAFADVVGIRLKAWRGLYRTFHEHRAVTPTGDKDAAS
ncbi:MAG TPA: dolichyl-phosphate beta-glucosyltransferase [Vicinamibacterales bacterium]